MPLTSEHQTHIHHIFYRLCAERGWAIGFPTTFDYGYLPDGNIKVQAQIRVGEGKPLILIHPLAFDRCRGHLVKGLLHHELIHHMLGEEEGHGPRFTAIEQGWDGFFLFKQESSDFARWLARSKPRFTLYCDHCGSIFERHSLPRGRLACRACCDEHAGGSYDETYDLHIGGVSLSSA